MERTGLWCSYYTRLYYLWCVTTGSNSIDNLFLSFQMKKDFKITEWPIGFVSDLHTNLSNLEKIITNHPEVKQWFCLGDIIDFINIENNKETMETWIEKYSHIPCLRGNHEEMVQKDLLNITFSQKVFLVNKLYTSFDILLPNQFHLLCYHNKPKDNWSFLEKTYTEREFIDTFDRIGDHVVAVCVAHNHQQFILDFPNTITQIWSIGAAKFGEYALIDEKGIAFKRLQKVK